MIEPAQSYMSTGVQLVHIGSKTTDDSLPCPLIAQWTTDDPWCQTPSQWYNSVNYTIWAWTANLKYWTRIEPGPHRQKANSLPPIIRCRYMLITGTNISLRFRSLPWCMHVLISNHMLAVYLPSHGLSQPLHSDHVPKPPSTGTRLENGLVSPAPLSLI